MSRSGISPNGCCAASSPFPIGAPRLLSPAPYVDLVVLLLLVRRLLLLLLVLLLQLPLQRNTEHQVLYVAHGHVHLGPQIGWQVTAGERGGSDGSVELAYLSFHKAVELVLCPVDEGVDDPRPLADLLDRSRLEIPTLV